MASATYYLDGNEVKAIIPPKNKVLDVTKLIDDLNQHSLKSNVRELLECSVCLTATDPPLHQCSSGRGGVYLSASLPKSYSFLCSCSGQVPYFDGTNYTSWMHSMKVHLKATYTPLWDIVETGFFVVDEANPTFAEYLLLQNNARATDALFCALSEDEFSRVGTLESAKEIWNTLQEIHVGTSSVRELRVELLKSKLKRFALGEGESLMDMYHRLYNLVTRIRDLGDKDMTNSFVVRKMLRVMTARYPMLVTLFRQRDDLDELIPHHAVLIMEDLLRIMRGPNKCSSEIGVHNQVPPPNSCSRSVYGVCSKQVPYFDGTHYASWKHKMKFHFYSMSPLVWRIVEIGFVVVDKANPTEAEYRLIHNNALATNTLLRAISREQSSLVDPRDKESAKDIWNTLRNIHEGGTSFSRELRIALWKDKLWSFTLGKGESVNDMYTRLNILVNEIRSLGDKDMTNSFVVRKVLRVMRATNPTLVAHIRGRQDFNDLTPGDVFGRFLVHEMIEEDARIVRDLNKASKMKTNIRLKAKQVMQEDSSDEEEDSSDEDEDQMMQERALFLKKYGKIFREDGYGGQSRRVKSSESDKSRTRSRRCYMCGDRNHFIANCPNKNNKKQ